MATATVHTITAGDDPRCVAIAPLLEAMYSEEAEAGSLAVLAPDGAARWLKGAVAGLGWLGKLLVVEKDGRVVGFAHGTLRLQPDHLTGGAVGMITHIYVVPAYRREGAALALMRELEAWFIQRKVARTEITVVPGNQAAMAFWQAMGFTVSLHQLTRA